MKTEKIKKQTTFSCCVDSIDGGVAKLVFDDGEKKLLLPAEILPKGTKEGNWLTFSLTLDHASEQSAKKQVAELYSSLSEQK